MSGVEYARDTLAACLRFFRERAEESSYGYFCGDDPRDFTPDAEVCCEAEIAAHRAACAAWARGERPELPRRVTATIRGDTASLQPSGYGMGITTFVDDDMRDLAEQCEAAIARLDGVRT